jgi:hypothetical protein
MIPFPFPMGLFLIAVFAVWRVSYLIVYDEGPFRIMAGIRGMLDPDQKTWIGRGVNCMICVSFWAAWGILGLLFVPYGWIVVTGLALSGAVVVLKLWIEKRIR